MLLLLLLFLIFPVFGSVLTLAVNAALCTLQMWRLLDWKETALLCPADVETPGLEGNWFTVCCRCGDSWTGRKLVYCVLQMWRQLDCKETALLRVVDVDAALLFFGSIQSIGPVCRKRGLVRIPFHWSCRTQKRSRTVHSTS